MLFRELQRQQFFEVCLKRGSFRFGVLKGKLPSGRTFHYDLSDFPFSIDATPAKANELATRVIMAKYKFCNRDCAHPRNNQEIEIFNAVKKFILDQVASMQKYRAEKKEKRKA